MRWMKPLLLVLAMGLVALPADSRTREQVEWLADEVLEAGGEASVWLARPGSALVSATGTGPAGVLSTVFSRDPSSAMRLGSRSATPWESNVSGCQFPATIAVNAQATSSRESPRCTCGFSLTYTGSS